MFTVCKVWLGRDCRYLFLMHEFCVRKDAYCIHNECRIGYTTFFILFPDDAREYIAFKLSMMSLMLSFTNLLSFILYCHVYYPNY